MAIVENLYCLVMAGGQGTRFWPESTSKKPKQYLNLFSDNSLLNETFNRFEGLVDTDNRYVVTVESQVGIVNQQCSTQMAQDGVIVEPEGRNTAPCILLALLSLLEEGASANDVVAIVPADHVILNKSGFQKTLTKASQLAERQNKIVTIGIPPTFPHTGYGYIKKGEEFENSEFQVEAFKEKPDSDTATEYLKSGQYLWNAGMFVTPIGLMLKELEQYAPNIFEHAEPLKQGLKNFDALKESYGKVPSDSIDYAVMEKSENVMVVPAEFDWNDLGSWTALEDVCEKQNENAFKSKFSKNYLEGSQNNIVFAPNQLVCLHNVNDMIVVSNDNVLMVMPKKDGQVVKQIRGWVLEQSEYKNLI